MIPSRWWCAPGVAALAVAFGCAPSAPPAEGSSAEPARAVGASTAIASAAPAPSSRGADPPSAAASVAPAEIPSDAGSPRDAGTDGASAERERAEPEAPPDPLNKTRPPLDSEELQARARALFEAIVANDAARGDVFWFPKEPFIPLKDVKGPDRYWDTLHRTYTNDIAKLHRKRKSWDGAVFKGFTIGSTPKWVKPGEEANKIGYHRSFRGKIRYEIGGEPATIDVHTVISWQGRWYITHLSKFKK